MAQAAQGPVTVAFPVAQNCSFQPLTTAVAPLAALTATFSPPPSGLDQSVGVEYPRCLGDNSPSAPVPANAVFFRILSVVLYSGSEGKVWLTVDTPSAAADAEGLDLGDPEGSLPDGTPTYTISNGDAAEYPSLPGTLVQWVDGQSVVTISSNSLSASSLESLASSVAVG